jgi:hypothetical protein
VELLRKSNRVRDARGLGHVRRDLLLNRHDQRTISGVLADLSGWIRGIVAVPQLILRVYQKNEPDWGQVNS